MSSPNSPALNRLLGALRNLREELAAFEDITDTGVANTAMDLAQQIEVELGLSRWELPTHSQAVLDELLTSALEFLDHEYEVKHGYRSRGA